MGIDTDLLKLLSAAVVAVFLAIPTWKSRYFSNMGKRRVGEHAGDQKYHKTFNRGTVNEKKALRGVNLTFK